MLYVGIKTMKKILILITALVTAAIVGASEIEVPHVSVHGTAQIEVIPDLMKWKLTVETKGTDVQKLAEEHDRQVSVLLKFLKEEGIEEQKINTTRINFQENWEYKNKSRIKEGYIAATEIAFELTELDKYRTFWIGLSKVRGVRINSTHFDTTKRIDLQNESRLKALAEAKKKAISLTNALGSKIAEPLLIEEDLSVGQSSSRNAITNNLRQVASSSGTSNASLSLGTVSVSSRVLVKFRITEK
ncbi:MAG: SIMPL domain-containing protein [Opitutaceae bacterium]